MDALGVVTPSYQYRASHYKDKMVMRPSCLYDKIPDTWKDGLYIEMGAMAPCIFRIVKQTWY